MRLPLLTERNRKKALRVVLRLALVTLFAGCGKPDSASVPSPANSTCANVSYVGAAAATPASIIYPLETTATYGAQSKITITRGVAPFQVSSSSFVGLSKTKTSSTLTDGNGQPIFEIFIDKADAVPSTVDPSCTTYVFYLQPIGPFITGTYIEQVSVRDSTSSQFDIEVKATVKIPVVTP